MSKLAGPDDKRKSEGQTMTETDITRLWVYSATPLTGLTITLWAYAIASEQQSQSDLQSGRDCNRADPAAQGGGYAYATYSKGRSSYTSFWVRRRSRWRRCFARWKP